MFIIAAPPHPRLRACPPPLRAAAAAGRTGSKPGGEFGWDGVDGPGPGRLAGPSGFRVGTTRIAGGPC